MGRGVCSQGQVPTSRGGLNSLQHPGLTLQGGACWRNAPHRALGMRLRRPRAVSVMFLTRI